MYTVIQDRVPIKNDYEGYKIIGYLNKGEEIYPIKIIANWAMFLFNNKYVWVKMYDNNKYYIMDINKDNIQNKNNIILIQILLIPILILKYNIQVKNKNGDLL